MDQVGDTWTRWPSGKICQDGSLLSKGEGTLSTSSPRKGTLRGCSPTELQEWSAPPAASLALGHLPSHLRVPEAPVPRPPHGGDVSGLGRQMPNAGWPDWSVQRGVLFPWGCFLVRVLFIFFSLILSLNSILFLVYCFSFQTAF